MKLDLNKPVQTRDGNKVRILCTNRNGDMPIVGLVDQGVTPETVVAWALDGRSRVSVWGSQDDLINVPIEREVWVNGYEDKDFGSIYKTKECADRFALSNRISRQKFIIIEGQFDE